MWTLGEVGSQCALGGEVGLQCTLLAQGFALRSLSLVLKKKGSYLWLGFLIFEQSILHLMLLIKTSFCAFEYILSNEYHFKQFFVAVLFCLLRQGFTM